MLQLEDGYLWTILDLFYQEKNLQRFYGREKAKFRKQTFLGKFIKAIYGSKMGKMASFGSDLQNCKSEEITRIMA